MSTCLYIHMSACIFISTYFQLLFKHSYIKIRQVFSDIYKSTET